MNFLHCVANRAFLNYSKTLLVCYSRDCPNPMTLGGAHVYVVCDGRRVEWLQVIHSLMFSSLLSVIYFSLWLNLEIQGQPNIGFNRLNGCRYWISLYGFLPCVLCLSGFCQFHWLLYGVHSFLILNRSWKETAEWTQHRELFMMQLTWRSNASGNFSALVMTLHCTSTLHSALQ